MKAKFKKRFGAYLIDLMVLLIAIMVVYTVLPEGNNIHVLNKEMNTIIETALNKQISFSNFFNRFVEIIHDLDKERAIYHVINAFLLIGYFIIVPYFKEGQTLGMKLVGIKITREDGELLSLNDLLIRSLIIHGLGAMMISLACIYLLPSMSYFIATSIFNFIQILLVISCVFMILYRKDKRGLQDILSNTKVVTIKK